MNKKIYLASVTLFFGLIVSSVMATPNGPQTDGQGYCYAEYSSPNGYKMYTLNVGEKNLDGCRKFDWTPFRATFFARCQGCKVIREDFISELDAHLKSIATRKSVGWPYEVKGSLRFWFGNISRDEALKTCRQDAGGWMTQHLSSEHICIE